MRKLAWSNVKDDSFKVQLSKIVNISTRSLPATRHLSYFTLLDVARTNVVSHCSTWTNEFYLDHSVQHVIVDSWDPLRAWRRIIWVVHLAISMALYTIGSAIITNMKMDPNGRSVVTVSGSCLNVRKVLWEDNSAVDTTLIEPSSRNLKQCQLLNNQKIR